MAAFAVFTSCANSHPFQERRVALTEPNKIGRSVAQSRPTQDNAVFDCKVLSRNHALMWYDNSKFYLQDTKSSNGTFVNSQRLSKGSEESEPKEIFSGDTIQFGVDVMENSRKVTHSCIIATIQLYHVDGREALNSHSSGFSSAMSAGGHSLQSQELYQLAQYLQDALHREQMLENKLATLQRLVQGTQEASENGWQALVDEDRLLSRLEVLENQLSVYSKSQTEDTLRQELVSLHEDKFSYETTAKESLRKVLEEKLDAIRRISELEHSLSNTEEECCHLQTSCQSAEKELQQLAEKFQDQSVEVKDLMEKLQEVERKQQEMKNELENEKQELQNRIEELLHVEESLHAKVEALQADNDFTTEQLNNMKVKLETMKKLSSTDSPKIQEFSHQGVQVDLVNLLDLHHLMGANNEKSDDESEDLDDEGRNHKYIDDHFEESSVVVDQLNNDTPKQVQNGTTHWPAGSPDAVAEQELLTLNCASTNHAEAPGTTSNHEEVAATMTNKPSSIKDEAVSLRLTVSSLNQQIATLKKELLHYKVKQEVYVDEMDLHSPPPQTTASPRPFSSSSSSSTTVGGGPDFHTSQPRSLTVGKRGEAVDDATTLLANHGDMECVVAGAAGVVAAGNIDSMQQEIQIESARNRAEFSVLKDECAHLRQRVHDIETEMKMSRCENYQLKEEYSRLQESYRALEQLKTKLQSSESTWQINVTDAQKQAEITHDELSKARVEIVALLARCAERDEQITVLRMKLEGGGGGRTVIDGSPKGGGGGRAEDVPQGSAEDVDDDDYSVLSFQCRTLSAISMIPLLMLLFAFLLAFLPFLSTITATSNPSSAT